MKHRYCDVEYHLGSNALPFQKDSLIPQFFRNNQRIDQPISVREELKLAFSEELHALRMRLLHFD